MEGTSFLDHANSWPLLERFGITHPFWNLSVDTIVSTWAVMGILFVTTLLFRLCLYKKESILRFYVMELIGGFADMVTQNLGSFQYKHFSFIVALFFFILGCNSVGVLPFLIEPTIDVNTTLALGFIGLIYRDIFALKEHGLRGYIKELFQPLFVMFPLHVMGKFSSVISISFRLFGNIFAGYVISHLWFDFANSNYIALFINYFSGIGLLINLFFGLFEGLIQAFVFAMLSLTYLSIALAHEDHGADHTAKELEKVIE